jgi:exopolysaccharide biosynthesis protein
MAADVIQLQVVPGDDAPDEDEALAASALALGNELAELDVDDVVPVTAGEAPAGAKGIELLALGGLLIRLGRSSHALRQVVDAIRDWVGRTEARSVRMTVDGDVLEVTGATGADVKQLIDAWVERHGEH